LVLISPDAGAEKKIKELGNLLSSNEKKVPLLCARKVRDTLTGAILATEIYGDVQGRDLIILDDICDGGRTFVELAKALRNQGAGDLYLYVTHGIFSKGLTELKEYFKRVYCYYPLRGSHSNTDPFLITLT
jgi:ribose-phosphate pyrophosphokinase